MKKLATMLVLVGALTLPRLAQARPVTLITSLKQFGGYSAYVVLYVTDPHGRYIGTVWMAGQVPWYQHELIGWERASHGRARLNGITGASVGAGQTLTVHTNFSDALINAGYRIHADVRAYGMFDGGREVDIPISTKDANRKIPGRAYVRSFEMRM